jgi:Tfp pilus assembly protein PilN
MRAVNLIPTDQRGGASVGAGRSEGAVYAVLVLLGGLALFAFLYGRAERQISSRQGQAAQLTARAASAQAETTQLAPYTTFAQLREQRMKDVSELVDSRFDWAHAFHEFGRVLPSGVSISSLSGTIGSAAGTSGASGGSSSSGAKGVSSATPPGSIPVFAITGCATSQPVVAKMLDRLRLIDGVTDVTLQSSSVGSSASSGAGSCTGQPAYAVQVLFSPIPQPSVAQALKVNASVTKGAGSVPSQGGAG